MHTVLVDQGSANSKVWFGLIEQIVLNRRWFWRDQGFVLLV
mgnify:CR=1 FL=1